MGEGNPVLRPAVFVTLSWKADVHGRGRWPRTEEDKILDAAGLGSQGESSLAAHWCAPGDPVVEMGKQDMLAQGTPWGREHRGLMSGLCKHAQRG